VKLGVAVQLFDATEKPFSPLISWGRGYLTVGSSKTINKQISDLLMES